MATISTSIELYDKVSAPINKMISALDSMISTYESVESAMNTGFDTAPINEARNAIDQAAEQMNELEQNIRESEQQQKNLNEQVKQGASDMDSLSDKVLGMVSAYASLQGIQKLINLSDEYVQTNARLNMINDGLQTQSELQDKIFASAQRSRASYTATADAVAKLSLNAKDAFKSNDETIAFAENLNKLFAIAGTEQASISSATLQLTQALGSGVLRGEEFNAVFEAAPNIMQTVADYMNVPIGQLRSMAQEGQITADVVKNALLSSTDEINTQFESMPMTWNQVWTGVMNELYVASQPILELISLLAQNWSVLEPIVLGVATAVGLYTGALLVYNAVKGTSALLESVHAAAQMMSTGATFAATAAQHGFNVALLACPLTWIIVAIIAVIAVIYAVIAAINKVQGTTISATGVILGVLMTAVAFIWNLIVGVLNAIIQLVWSIFVEPFIGIIEFILNACNGGFNSFGDAVANLLGQIISWFLSLGKVVTKIIDAIFGTDWTSGLNSLQDKVLKWGKNENAITLSREAPTLQDAGIDRWSYGDAYDTGYSWGEGAEESISNIFGGGTDGLLGGGYDASQIPSNIAGITDNTGSMADSMEITSEELKYLRDIAETDAVNRFTTAEIKVEMTNNNNISSDTDLDGIVDYLANGVNEAMEKAAEGVHE
jgi:tape measure domain-containing protein